MYIDVWMMVYKPGEFLYLTATEGGLPTMPYSVDGSVAVRAAILMNKSSSRGSIEGVVE
jgi:hypothetical protein